MDTTQSLDQEIRDYLHTLELETSEHFLNWLQHRRMRKGTRGYVSVIKSGVEPSWWNLVLLLDGTCQYNHTEYCLGHLEYRYQQPPRVEEAWKIKIYDEEYLSRLTQAAHELGEKYHVPMNISFKKRRHLKTYCWKEYRDQPEEEENEEY